MNCRPKQTALDQLVAVRDWEKYLLWTLEGSTTSLFQCSTVIFVKFKSARATNTCCCSKCTFVKRVYGEFGRWMEGWVKSVTSHGIFFIIYMHFICIFLFLIIHKIYKSAFYLCVCSKLRAEGFFCFQSISSAEQLLWNPAQSNGQFFMQL